MAIFGQVNRVFQQETTSNNSGSPGFIYLDRDVTTEVKLGIRVKLVADQIPNQRAAREFDKRTEQEVLRGRR
jgi:hypothetical protein